MQQLQLKLELAKRIMFTFNKQFLMLETTIVYMEPKKEKCLMSFSSRLRYMKQLKNNSNVN